MIQSIVHIALFVKDYDEAIQFYTNKLHFIFLGTDDFWCDYNEMKEIGIEFVREPKEADLE